MMLQAVNACLELDGHSFTKSAAVSVENPLSSPVHNLPDVQEVLLTLLGDRNLFYSNVPLAHDYNIGMDFQPLHYNIIDIENLVNKVRREAFSTQALSEKEVLA